MIVLFSIDSISIKLDKVAHKFDVRIDSRFLSEFNIRFPFLCHIQVLVFFSSLVIILENYIFKYPNMKQ